jgi:hypothetical protein
MNPILFVSGNDFSATFVFSVQFFTPNLLPFFLFFFQRKARSDNFFKLVIFGVLILLNRACLSDEIVQGCQIFLGVTYQNGENIPNGRKTYQMVINTQ